MQTAISMEFDIADQLINKLRWKDVHLLAPYEDAVRRSDRMAGSVKESFLAELHAVKDVVRGSRKRYMKEVENKFKSKPYSKERREALLVVSSSIRSMLSELDRIFISSGEATMIAASYAYYHDIEEWNETRGSRFYCEGTLYVFVRSLRE